MCREGAPTIDAMALNATFDLHADIVPPTSDDGLGEW